MMHILLDVAGFALAMLLCVMLMYLADALRREINYFVWRRTSARGGILNDRRRVTRLFSKR